MDKLVAALRVAKRTLDFVPVSVPGLAPAVEVALSIAELVQETRDTRDECCSLAIRAASFSLQIYDQLNGCAFNVDITATAAHIDTLLHTLKQIENLMERRTTKNFFKFLLHKDKWMKEAQDLSTLLDDAFRLFQVQDSIVAQQERGQIAAAQMHLVQEVESSRRITESVWSRTGEISGKVDRLDDKMVELMRCVRMNTLGRDEDGTMILRQEDVVLVREIDVSADAMDDDLGERVVQYQARIRKTGQPVIVKKFPRQNEDFRAAVQRSKRVMHPHIAQILAYSSPDCPHAFVVIDGGTEQKPFEDCFRALHGVKKYLQVIDIGKQLYSAFRYMENLGLMIEDDDTSVTPSTLGSRDLYFTPEGTIRWDIDSWNHSSLPVLIQIAEGYIETELDELKAITNWSLQRLHASLEALDPIERSAALLKLWDRLLDFVDFNRAEDCFFVMGENIPWVGSAIKIGGPLQTPEGKVAWSDPRVVEYIREYPFAQLLPFNYDDPEENEPDALDGIALHEMREQQPDMGKHESSRVTWAVDTPDRKWVRYTVRDMDYGLCLRTIQTVQEATRCRSFFLTQAIYLDLPRYLSADYDPTDMFSIVHKLHFVTYSHLVPLGSSPIGKPPRRLYFYERLHVPGSRWDYDTPWGYWSTSAKPIHVFPDQGGDDGEYRRFVKRTKIDVQYVGFSNKLKFTWLQTLAGFVFRTEVMVAVESLRITPDERLLLWDLQRCLTEAYESNRQATRDEVRRGVRRKRLELEDEDEDLQWRSKGRHSRLRRRIDDGSSTGPMWVTMKEFNFP
ncbi:hypothetical protein BV20DRAFT_1057084 [Pilatotrama ljubarskyi]|nr:hypothetical protein BV20DRAFT_1057084 [Pilatotrama ljubarskyi]